MIEISQKTHQLVVPCHLQPGWREVAPNLVLQSLSPETQDADEFNPGNSVKMPVFFLLPTLSPLEVKWNDHFSAEELKSPLHLLMK